MATKFQTRRARPLPPNILLGLLFVILAATAGWFANRHFYKSPAVTDYRSCVKAAGSVMLSSPAQCSYNGQSFISPEENIPPAY